MSNEQYLLKNFTDPEWVDKYISEMGFSGFFQYRTKLFRMFDSIETGKSIRISDWCEPKNIDLFIKLSCCYINCSKGTYDFNSDYTIIKHIYDAREMEELDKFYLRISQRREVVGSDIGEPEH